MAERYGLMMIGKQRFQNYFQQRKDHHEGKGLLGKMNALETFPSIEQVSQLSAWQFIYDPMLFLCLLSFCHS